MKKDKKIEPQEEQAEEVMNQNCDCTHCNYDGCQCSDEECTNCDDCQCGSRVPDEYKNKYLRALADYQNLENRMETMRSDIQRKTRFDIIGKFLGVLDHLEKAEAFMEDDGLKIIANELRSVIKELGLEELDLVGKEFDPYTAEAIDVVEGEQDNIVVEVIRKGYKVGNDILRPAHVRVSKSVVN